jgi:hypothetical protein
LFGRYATGTSRAVQRFDVVLLDLIVVWSPRDVHKQMSLYFLKLV